MFKGARLAAVAAAHNPSPCFVLPLVPDVLDADIDVNKALAAEKSMRDYIKGKYPDLIKRIDEQKNLTADDEKALTEAIGDWKANGTY